jgi:hypothetical protein
MPVGPELSLKLIIKPIRDLTDGRIHGQEGFDCLREEGSRRILDHDYTVARYDEAVCNRCRNGAQRNRHHPTGSAHRLGVACLRACAAACGPHLADQFALPFRRRPAWAVDADGQSRLVEDRR